MTCLVSYLVSDVFLYLSPPPFPFPKLQDNTLSNPVLIPVTGPEKITFANNLKPGKFV